MHARFTNATRNQLGVLRAKIQNKNGIVTGRHGTFYRRSQPSPIRNGFTLVHVSAIIGSLLGNHHVMNVPLFQPGLG